jgi:hypothetical protein
VRTKLGQIVLTGIVMFMIGFAAWGWLRPYEWNADPKAGMLIHGAELRRDHQNYWLDLHVKAWEGEEIDLSQRPRLLIGESREILPADTRIAGAPEVGIHEAWFRFWLEADDLPHRMNLGVRDGILRVKTKKTPPPLESGDSRHFTTHHW